MNSHTASPQATSRNHTAQLLDLSLTAARLYSLVQAMSFAASVRTPQASPQDLSLIEKGKSFKACVSLALGNHVTNWSQSVPSEAEKQMQLMVERRMQLSQLVQKCGGQHMFTAASAASADEYIKWATEELKKDDGKNAKVRSAATCPLACHALPPPPLCSHATIADRHHQDFRRCRHGQPAAGDGLRLPFRSRHQARAAGRLGRKRQFNCTGLQCVLCSLRVASCTVIISGMPCRAFTFAHATALLAALIYWPLTLVSQNLPSSEKSGMPPLDTLFAPPYSWLEKGAHIGNVQRSLASGSRASVQFNGHVHRGRPGGG